MSALFELTRQTHDRILPPVHTARTVCHLHRRDGQLRPEAVQAPVFVRRMSWHPHRARDGRRWSSKVPSVQRCFCRFREALYIVISTYFFDVLNARYKLLLQAAKLTTQTSLLNCSYLLRWGPELYLARNPPRWKFEPCLQLGVT